ncbi:MAG TPA: hypothetical protein VGU21_06810 [Streptosporangiaceae bacterium]|nr:hypothetical protein [Streptosporangiaceae bacterium]
MLDRFGPRRTVLAAAGAVLAAFSAAALLAAGIGFAYTRRQRPG